MIQKSSRMRHSTKSNNKILSFVALFGCFLVAFIFLSGCGKQIQSVTDDILSDETESIESHPLVDSARKQMGVVIAYDDGYYQGGYPPSDRGACTDVVDQALRDNGYNLKEKIDADMRENASRYEAEFDPHINFRRVRNVKIFLDTHAQQLPTCIEDECIQESDWKPGDIITYDKMQGGNWHIALISNKTTKGSSGKDPIPLLIHNYGRGTVEDNMLQKWPTKVTGHYRMEL